MDGKRLTLSSSASFRGVDEIRLGPRLPDELHLASVGDPAEVTLGLELIVEPLPVERRFDADSDRRRERTEAVTEVLERDRHAPDLTEGIAVTVESAGRDVALVEIQPDESHQSLPRTFR